jgi:hypothetical protein
VSGPCSPAAAARERVLPPSTTHFNHPHADCLPPQAAGTSTATSGISRAESSTPKPSAPSSTRATAA